MKLKCPCENISIVWDRKPDVLHARACSCTYCQTQEAKYVSDPNSSLRFYIQNHDKHRIIQHGHNTANFHECTNCGLAFVSCEIDGQLYGVINAKVMGVDSFLQPSLNDFSQESVAERLQRRQKNWCKVESES